MGVARYKAFISYSHRDERWARWLQRALESYRVPPRLVGTEAVHGIIPARLRPVFRDRVDLSSASDLEDQILRELHESETLIVICSPAAAESHWVNEEIRDYRKIGRGDRILALVVDGDPLGEDPTEACFPPALLESSDGGGHEPLAADVRRYADGKRLALLKIIAGMLGIRLDRLRQRDAHRRMQRRIVQGVAALGLVAVIFTLGWNVETKRQAAQVQRANTQDLLQFMLGELNQLKPIVGLEVFEPGDNQQMLLSQELGLASLDEKELLDKAKEWRGSGLDLKWDGDLVAARIEFDHSRAALLELFQREGSTQRALFELGQAEFYVGETHLQMGEVEEAEEHWSRYGALSRRLLNSDPNNPVYVMELSYTLANMGALEQMKTVPDLDLSLEMLQMGVRYTQIAVLLDPGNQDYREAQITQLSWLADAFLEKCDLGNALKVRRQTVELRRGLVRELPKDSYQKRELAYTLTGLAGVQEMIGINSLSRSSYEEGLALLQTLHLEEPDNGNIEWQLVYRSARLARLLNATGETDEAVDIIFPLVPRVEDLSRSEIASDKFVAIEAARFKVDYALLLLRQGNQEEGREQLKTAVDMASEQIVAHPGFRDGFTELVMASFEYWQEFGAMPGGPVSRQLEEFQSGPDTLASCRMAGLGARMAVMNGVEGKAGELTGYLLGKGYFKADFVDFCRRHGLCEFP